MKLLFEPPPRLAPVRPPALTRNGSMVKVVMKIEAFFD
jgi:hypothetical protein